jgi:hypothetical protein
LGKILVEKVKLLKNEKKKEMPAYAGMTACKKNGYLVPHTSYP